MNTRSSGQDDSLTSVRDDALERCYARRRRILGILLIVIGSVWLGLRVTGSIGDLPSPVDWVAGTVVMVARCITDDGALQSQEDA